MKIATGILLVVLVSTAVFSCKNKDHDALYDKYFMPYTDVITLQGTESIMDAYNRKDYPEAVRQMEVYLSVAPRNHNVRFYYGVSLIASGKEKPGVAELDTVIKGNGLLKSQAEWYRALGLLKQNDIDGVKEQLKSIPNGHEFYDRAAQLLQEVSQL